jgi:hypothetical protein
MVEPDVAEQYSVTASPAGRDPVRRRCLKIRRLTQNFTVLADFNAA